MNGARSAYDFNEHDALRLLSVTNAALRKTGKKWLSIRIADNGSGISADAVANIFTPFVTTKETGTGLGLSICRRIAADHDGALTVQNRPSGGAEFTLTLPRCD
jgi:signal transduction histidine kinase